MSRTGKGTPVVQIRLGELTEPLVSRARGGEVTPEDVRRELGRYFHALGEALRSVELSRNEALLLCDALNGTLTEPHTATLLWAGVADAIRLDGLDAKWGVDGPALVAKLRALDYWQALALTDAVERWWHGSARWADNDEGLRAVGLVREPRRAPAPER